MMSSSPDTQKYVVIDTKSNQLGTKMPIYCQTVNALFPNAVPDEFLKMLKTCLASELGEFRFIGGVILENEYVYIINDEFMFDMFLVYSADSYKVSTLCDIIMLSAPYMKACKPKFVELLKKHTSVGRETYVWNQLASKMEYSYYQFRKRNWPVKKESNIDWQTIANKLGLVDKIYPGEAKAHKQKARDFKDPKQDPIRKIQDEKDAKIEKYAKDAKDAKDAKGVDGKVDDDSVHVEPDSDSDEKTDAQIHEQNRVDYTNEIKKMNDSEANIECDSDEDEDDETILALAKDKNQHARRAEKLRVLRLQSNYAVYGIPDVKTVERKAGLDMKLVVKIYDACCELKQTNTAVLFACHLMVSRKFFHLVIKNPTFMDRIRELMKTHIRIHKFIKYVMQYSFYMLGKEERLSGRKITSDNRSIMTAEQFRSLPVFDGTPDESPYVFEIYDKGYHSLVTKSIPFYLGGKREFTTDSVFKQRMSVMTGGMLDDINLSTNNAFLTGSSLVPCIVTNPLENNFATREEPFKEFTECLYPSYESIKQYTVNYEAKKEIVWKEYKSNFTDKYLSKCSETYNSDDDFILALKEVPVAGNLELADMCEDLIGTFEQLIYMEKKLSDLDIAIMADTRDQYNTHVHAIFKEIEVNVRKRYGDVYERRVYLFKQPLKYGFKWVLKGPGAKRPIDFFRIKCQPHTLTYRFHVNIVRFWWDGVNLSGLSSGVCAALTGINQWYRWFSNNKDPMDIVLKNTQRGYATMQNALEITVIKEYINTIKKYAHLRKNFVVGKISETHSIFENTGGIRYQFPDMVVVCDKNDDSAQYVPVVSKELKRVGCSLDIIGTNGTILAPKIYAFESIVNDLLD
jgi:hypothetical protein